MYFLISAFLTLIDIVFLTNLYQKRISLKNYWVMVLIMTSSVVFLTTILNGQNKIICQMAVCYFIMRCFFKSFKFMNLFNLCMIFMQFLETSMVASLASVVTYRDLLILVSLIKLFIIFIIFDHLKNIEIKIIIETITTRMLYLLFSFSVFAWNLYVNLNWRG